MARDLRLQVLLSAVDKATGPLKKISGGSIGAARALKETRDRLKQLQTQQRDVSSFRTMANASKQTGDQLKRSQDRVRELSRQLGATAAPTKQLSDEFRRAVREAQGLKSKHQEQQRELHGLRTRLNDAGISTRNLSEHERRLRTDLASTNTTLKRQEEALRRVTQQQQRLQRANAQYQKTRQVAGSMAGSGARGMAVGGGGLYAASRLLGPGVEFDTTMSRVQALSRLDKGDERLSMLRTQSRELGAKTLFTSTQVAEGQAFLAMAGFDPEKIRDSMAGILDVAKAGNMEIGETADIASNILTGLNLQADQMDRVADVLTGAFTRSNTSISTLGETMKYAAPGASQFGIDLETVAAMAAKLGDAGIQGSMGGTGIRRIISRLAAPNKAAREALEKLGVSAQDAQGNMRNLPEVLSDIYKASRDMGDIERGSLWKAIAGETGANAMGILVDQAGGNQLQELIAILQTNQGEAAQVAAIMADNFAGDWDQLKSAWADVGIELFEQQDGSFREMVRNLTAVVRGIGAWIRENPELAGQIIKVVLAVAALTAGMGALTLMLASILGPFAVVRYAMTLFGIKSLGAVAVIKKLGAAFLWLGRALMLNPIGLAVTAIIAGAYLIYRNWDKVVPFFQELWAELREGVSGGLAGIGGLILNWSPLGMFYRAFAGVMNYFGIDLPSRFTEFGGMLMSGMVQGIKSGLGSVREAITGAGDQAIGWFKDKLGIRSPSRVFAALGDDTMAGLRVGLQRSQNGPLGTVLETGKQLAKAGALALGIGGAGQALAIDSRPALQAGQAPIVVQGDTITIQITAASGSNSAELESMINRVLDQRERGKAARIRSALYDTD